MPEPTFDPESGMWFGEPIKFPEGYPERSAVLPRDPESQAGWPSAEQLGLSALDFYWPHLVEQRSNELARQRDAYARRLLEDSLPRPLRWAIDRPRAMKVLLRLMPRWQPVMTVVNLRYQDRYDSVDPWAPMSAQAARQVAREWTIATRASGGQVPNSGLIFTYTDPSGLPAEVHGAD